MLSLSRGRRTSRAIPDNELQDVETPRLRRHGTHSMRPPSRGPRRVSSRAERRVHRLGAEPAHRPARAAGAASTVTVAATTLPVRCGPTRPTSFCNSSCASAATMDKKSPEVSFEAFACAGPQLHVHNCLHGADRGAGGVGFILGSTTTGTKRWRVTCKTSVRRGADRNELSGLAGVAALNFGKCG